MSKTLSAGGTKKRKMPPEREPNTMVASAEVAQVSNATDTVEASRLAVAEGDSPLWPAQEQFHVDRAVDAGEVALIIGWTKVAARFELPTAGAVTQFPRPDVEAFDPESCGFAIAVSKPREAQSVQLSGLLNGSTLPLTISLNSDINQLTAAYSDIVPRVPMLMPLLAKADHIAATLEQALNQCKGEFVAMGHIDAVIGLDGISTTVSGWAFAGAEVTFWLSVANRPWQPIQRQHRLDRPDVSSAFAEHKGLTSNAGFLSALPYCVTKETPLRIVAASRAGFKLLAAAQAGEILGDVYAYSERIFQFGSPQNDFVARLANIDGQHVATGIGQRVKQRKQQTAITQKAFGRASKPQVSIIVPIYGRYDFIEHQLIEFSRDADFTGGRCELIYVIDDPKLVAPILGDASLLFDTYRVPFRLAWTGTNMGYSGANNLGASLATADTLLLLNSDIIPLSPLWVSTLYTALQADAKIGALGARLKFADGSIQHVGMEFRFDDALGVWLNMHPSMGLCLNEITDAAKQVKQVHAATGACLMVKAKTYQEVGGLDEEYLYGDFEDSDFCLKLLETGRTIHVHHGVNLCHLTRQSLTSLGAADFRGKVVLYNAWRHSKRWHESISRLMAAA